MALESFTGAFGGIVTFNWAPEPIVVATQLEAAAEKLNDMHLPLMASRDISIEDVRENFEAEHSPDGAPWQPWSPKYAASGDTGPGILKRTMDLMESSTSSGAWPISTRELFFSFGALPEYGIWHQTGVSRASGGRGVTRAQNIETTKFLTQEAPLASGKEFFGQNDLPARPFAGISEETEFKIIDVFDAWFGNVIGLAVGGRGQVQTRLGGRFGSNVVDFTPS